MQQCKYLGWWKDILVIAAGVVLGELVVKLIEYLV